MRSPLLKILVCYHKISPIIANEILQPILVGAKNAPKTLHKDLQSMCRAQDIELLRDDCVIGGGGAIIA